MWNILERVGLIVFGLALGLLALEIGVRLFGLEKDTFWEPHAQFGWFHIPDREGWWTSSEFRVRVKFNSHGLRGPELSYEKPANTIRIPILGDSVTEGLQVPLEETFAHQLESLLNTADAGRTYEVINAGVSKYGTDNELLFFQHEGYKYQADVVILAFFTTNDVADNSPEFGGGSPYFVVNDGGQLEVRDFPVASVSNQSLMRKVKSFLSKHSQLYNFMSRTVRSLWPDLARFLESTGIMTPHQPAQDGIDAAFFVYAPNYTPEWESAWDLTEALILQLKQEVESRNAKFLVVTFSDQFVHVREERWQEYLDAAPTMKALEWDLDKPDRLMVEFLDAQEITHLSTIESYQMQAKTSGELLYFPHDGHLNAAGHRLAAQLIYEKLVADQLAGK